MRGARLSHALPGPCWIKTRLFVRFLTLGVVGGDDGSRARDEEAPLQWRRWKRGKRGRRRKGRRGGEQEEEKEEEKREEEELV